MSASMLRATTMQDAGAFVAGSLSLAQQIQSENANAMPRHLQSSGPTREFNTVLFWSINSVWFILVMAFVIWMWKFNGTNYLMSWALNWASDGVESDSDTRRQENEAAEKTVPIEARRVLLRNYFRKAKVHMVVCENDILTGSRNESAALEEASESPEIVDSSPPVDRVSVESSDDDNIADLEAGAVVTDANDPDESCMSSAVNSDSIGMRVLTRSLSTAELGHLVLHTSRGDRLVPNCCAVCLCPYEEGDDVVWSMNECCIHAFHEDCVTEWLTKLQEGNSCPCCRSVFVDSYEDKPVKAICSWRPGPPVVDVNVTSP